MKCAHIPGYAICLAAQAVGCGPPAGPAAGTTEAPPASETVAQAINGATDSVMGPNKLREFSDCGGRVHTAVWWCFTGQGEVHNAVCPLGDSSFVAVGGAAWAYGGESFPGAYIVDQFVTNPTGNRDAYQASSKSHGQNNSHLLIVEVIGLKITGVSRSQLLANLREDVQTSFVASNRPFESLPVPSGRILVGGTSQLNWFKDVTPGQLMVGSWGSNASALWQASSIEHIQADSLRLTMRLTSIAASVGGIDLNGFDQSQAITANSGLGEARVTTGTFAPTAIGAWSTFNGPGRFLVKVSPEFDDRRPRDFVVQSKDHLQADGGTTFINVVGLGQRFSTPTRCVSPTVF
jgi:hypothetical protein